MNRRFSERLRGAGVMLGMAGASAFVVLPDEGCTGFLPEPVTMGNASGFADNSALYSNDWNEFSAGIDDLLDELNSL